MLRNDAIVVVTGSKMSSSNGEMEALQDIMTRKYLWVSFHYYSKVAIFEVSLFV